jgi:hypothetical protein
MKSLNAQYFEDIFVLYHNQTSLPLVMVIKKLLMKSLRKKSSSLTLVISSIPFLYANFLARQEIIVSYKMCKHHHATPFTCPLVVANATSFSSSVESVRSRSLETPTR